MSILYEGGIIDGMHAVSLYCRNHSIYSARHTLVSKLCEMSPLLGNVPLNSYRNCDIASWTLPLLFMHANAPLVFDGQTVTPTGVLPQPKQRDRTCSSHVATTQCEPIEYLVYNFQKEHANPQHVYVSLKAIFFTGPCVVGPFKRLLSVHHRRPDFRTWYTVNAFIITTRYPLPDRQWTYFSSAIIQ